MIDLEMKGDNSHSKSRSKSETTATPGLISKEMEEIDVTVHDDGIPDEFKENWMKIWEISMNVNQTKQLDKKNFRLIKRYDNSYKIIGVIRATETHLRCNLNILGNKRDPKTLRYRWNNDWRNFTVSLKVKKKWSNGTVYGMIKWKFKVLNKQLREQWKFERKRLLKLDKMVDLVRQHLYDKFEEFLVETSNVLGTNARLSAELANEKFGFNFNEEWFMDCNIEAESDFTIINMHEEREEYWRCITKDLRGDKRATRLEGISALIWDENVCGIQLQDEDVGMLKKEVYLIEEGSFKKDVSKIGGALRPSFPVFGTFCRLMHSG
jgi:hypothetical protein